MDRDRLRPVTGVNPPFNDPIPEPFRNLSPERSHVSKRVSFGISDRAFRTVPTFAIEDAPFTDRENSRSTTVYKKGPLRGRRKVPLCDRFRGRLARKLECLDVTQSGPDAPAQSVGRVARLSGNVRQPNHVLAN